MEASGPAHTYTRSASTTSPLASSTPAHTPRRRERGVAHATLRASSRALQVAPCLRDQGGTSGSGIVPASSKMWEHESNNAISRLPRHGDGVEIRNICRQPRVQPIRLRATLTGRGGGRTRMAGSPTVGGGWVRRRMVRRVVQQHANGGGLGADCEPWVVRWQQQRCAASFTVRHGVDVEAAVPCVCVRGRTRGRQVPLLDAEALRSDAHGGARQRSERLCGAANHGRLHLRAIWLGQLQPQVERMGPVGAEDGAERWHWLCTCF